MHLKVTGQNSHNGFQLAEPFTYDRNLVVLTGRNGCGKTRLLESIQQRKSLINLNGQEINDQEVMLVTQAQLAPNFGGAYNDANFQTRITSSLQKFDRVKVNFDAPYVAVHESGMGMEENSLPYESLYKLCNSIAVHLNKLASELTHDEITLHFEDQVQTVLGFQNLSGICNQYIKRKNLNKYNEYLAKHAGEDVTYLTEEQFLKRFKGKPWTILNRIIQSTFDDKFYFTEPDETSKSYAYNASLIQRDNGQPVSVQALSSGEKTLLWLALTLFNSQYYDSSSVKTPKLLLLDEPDAFLHPQMVVKMYRVLETFATNFESCIFITTHSPTTVALAPENSTYVVTDRSIDSITKDQGVAELLDGITQISISPENRRQVFVESQYDANVFQAIFSKLLNNSDKLDPKISLNFVSSGPKMPEQQLKDKIKQVLKIDDEELLGEFVKSLNGVGNCVQVIGQVEALDQTDNETVRGIIDWDLKNQPSKYVSVLAHEYAYSIENITLDPICILLLLHTDKPENFTMNRICGSNIHFSDWLKDDDLLQESLDRFIGVIFDRESNKDFKLSYMSGKELLTDSEYLSMEGHPLENLIKEKIPELKSFARTGKDGELKYLIVTKSMINQSNGNFIPKVFESVLSSVQE